jgi:hypothetical protein
VANIVPKIFVNLVGQHRVIARPILKRLFAQMALMPA